MSHGDKLYSEKDGAGEPPFPLLYSCEQGDAETAKALLSKGADINLRSPEGWSPLIMAAKEGHVELLGELLAAGATPNPPDVSHTPIRGAAIFGRLACVEALLKANADPNALSAGAKTALMGAAMNGHADVAKLLLANAAKPELKNEFGETAEALATAKGHAACAEVLRGSS